MISATALVIGIGIIRMSSMTVFVRSGENLLPEGVPTLIISALTSIAAGSTALLLFSIFSKLIFVKRRRATRRNYLILVSLLSLYIAMYAVLWLQGRPNSIALVPVA